MMKQKRANDECSKKHLLESHPENPLPTCYSIYIIIYILYIIYILLYNYYYKIFLQVKKPFSTSFGPPFQCLLLPLFSCFQLVHPRISAYRFFFTFPVNHPPC